MSNKDFQNGFAVGMASKGQAQVSVPNPLECVKILNSAYMSTTFPENYEMTINIPLIISMNACFQGATGITKLTIKGNVAGNVIGMTGAFRVPTLEILDLSEFNAIASADGKHIFNGAKVLREIKGTLDFTNVTQCEGAFNICYELEEIRFKENSIGVSISFANSSKLSAETIQSIIDGLVTVETAQTLTLNSAIVLTDEQKATIEAKGWTLVQ